MLSIRKIIPGDLEFVLANPYQESAKNYPPLAAPESTNTYVFDGEVVAIGGIIDYYPGVGEASGIEPGTLFEAGHRDRGLWRQYVSGDGGVSFV